MHGAGGMRPSPATASEERTGDTYSNVTGQASATSNIRDAMATECRYNQSCKGHAG